MFPLTIWADLTVFQSAYSTNLFLGILPLVDSRIHPRKLPGVNIPAAKDDPDPPDPLHPLDSVGHGGGDSSAAGGLHHNLHPLGEEAASLGHLGVTDSDHPVQEVTEQGEGELANLETSFSEMSSRFKSNFSPAES